MKSLKESILSSTNTGKTAINRKKIEDWCMKHNIFDGDFKVNGKNEIEPNSPRYYTQYIKLEDDEVVPSYIKFADDEKLAFDIHSLDSKSYKYNGKNLDLHFLPNNCDYIRIYTESDTVSNLNVHANCIYLETTEKTKKFDNINIYIKGRNGSVNFCGLDSFKNFKQTNINIKHCNTIKFIFCEQIEKSFYEVLDIKNKKYDGTSDVTNKKQDEFINEFFGNNNMVEDLSTIIISTDYRLDRNKNKKRNKWFISRR